MVLKPCPFCGAVPQTQINLEEDTFMYYIACCHCNLAGVRSYDKEIAIEKWNTRHYPADVQQAVERMKPKEPMYSYEGTGKCPVCRELVNTTEDRNFCWRCGQALDWSIDG